MKFKKPGNYNLEMQILIKCKTGEELHWSHHHQFRADPQFLPGASPVHHLLSAGTDGIVFFLQLSYCKCNPHPYFQRDSKPLFSNLKPSAVLLSVLVTAPALFGWRIWHASAARWGKGMSSWLLGCSVLCWFFKKSCNSWNEDLLSQWTLLNPSSSYSI